MEHSEERQKSLKLSEFLSTNGFSPLHVALAREKASYNLDIHNAFCTNEHFYLIAGGSLKDGEPLDYGYKSMNELSDLDRLAFRKDLPVSEIGTSNNDWIIKVSDPKCIGYARLWVKRHEAVANVCEYADGKYYLSSRLIFERDRQKTQTYLKKVGEHGPALDFAYQPGSLEKLIKQYQGVPMIRINDPHFDAETDSGVRKFDIVYCVQSETWSAEADEWKSRQRLFDWPIGDLVEQIVQTGCIFAPVGSKESSDEIKRLQWRISFNKAESLLIRSFNQAQMCCKVLLKMFNVEILKHVSNKCTTSYIMKITIFWVSESMMQEEWQPKMLISCFLKCISKLRDWIMKREMPNYFIVGRNMFVPSELTNKIVYDTVSELDKVAKDPFGVIDRLEMMKGFLDAPMDDIESMFMDISNWPRMRLALQKFYFGMGTQILYKAYDYKNVPQSIHLCKDVLARLSKLGGYTKPMCDLVKNSLAVLHYANSMKPENAKIAWIEKYEAMKYFETSKNVNCTHAPLRTATRLLMEKRYSDALPLINQANQFYKSLTKSRKRSEPYEKQVSMFLEEVIGDSLVPMKEERRLEELKLIHEIAENDIQYQDLEITLSRLDRACKSIYKAYLVVWKRIGFDVIFTSADISVLPKPVRLEAMMKEFETKLGPIPNSLLKSSTYERTFILTLHPGMFACYLSFLYNLKTRGSRDVCQTCLDDMHSAIMEGPNECRTQTVGLNILAYCYLQLDMHGTAVKYLIESLRLISDDSNVACLHIQNIAGILLTIDINQRDITDKSQGMEVLDDTIIYQRKYKY